MPERSAQPMKEAASFVSKKPLLCIKQAASLHRRSGFFASKKRLLEPV
jgi:hypothetical protein